MKDKKGRGMVFIPIGYTILTIFVVIIALMIIFSNQGQKFKVTKDGVEVKDNIIDWCYDNNDCGKIKIGETEGIEWLNENAICTEHGKVLHSMARQDDDSCKLEGGVGVPDKFNDQEFFRCVECLEYEAQGYKIQVIN